MSTASHLISRARWALTVSVEKNGMPAPAPKMTTRCFSRWRMARRGMYGSATCCLAMPETTAGSRPMLPPPNTSPESLRRTRWKGVVWASVMAQGLLVGSVPAVGRSFHIRRTSAASGSGGSDLGQQARQHGREAGVVVLVVVRRGGQPHVAAPLEGHGRHDEPDGIQDRKSTRLNSV